MVVLRALHIVLVGLVAMFAYSFGRLRTLFVRDAAERARAIDRLRGRVLRQSLASLGTTFVKLGQVMSTRVDLFSPEIIGELRLLQDKLPPFDFAHVERAIQNDFGKPAKELFAELDPTPIAAASVAQVHRGKLRDGREVAVKVLRPGVRDRAMADAKVLGFFAKLAELNAEVKLSKPHEHLLELEQGIIEQTDLRIEAANYDAFRKNFESFEGVRFPHVHHDHSSEHVLTMEFVRGTKVDALPPGDHSALATRLSHLFMKMAFIDGLLHADLHPGNFVVTDDGTVVVFDVGLAKHLSAERRDEFVDFSRCVAMGTPEDLVEHAKTYHEYLEGSVDWDGFARDLEGFVKSFRGKTKEELELSQFFDTTFALGRKYKVRPVTEFTLIIVGVMTAEGVGKMLDAKTDFMGEIAMFLMPLLADRVARLAREEEERAAASA